MTEDAGLLLVLVALAVAAWSPWAGRRPVGSRSVRRTRSPRRRGRWSSQQAPAVDDAVVLDMVRAALHAGTDVVTAIESVGRALPTDQGEQCVRAARALRLGSTWDAAWQRPGELARALAPAWSDGVDPEPLLAHAAAAIRSGRQARAREAAARLGVCLVLPLGLCLLPAFVLLGLVPLLISAGLDLWSP